MTPSVVAASVRRGIIQWRVHGRDLLYVTLPGPGVRLSATEAIAVVTGLAEIAQTFPAEIFQRYARSPQ
jgi:hypothetical protein